MALALIFRSLVNLVKLPLFPLWWGLRRAARPRAPWLRVRIRSRVVELADPRRARLARFLPQLADRQPTALADLRRLATRIEGDKALRGVVVTLPMLAVGWATAKGLRDALSKLAQRTRLVVFLPEGGSHKELYVASAADVIVATPQAPLLMLGLSSARQYMKGLLDKVGVQVERFARAEYKTAAETLTRDTMSDANREQVGALLDSVDRELRDAIARGTLSAETVEGIFERGFVRGEDAQKMGLIDELAYEDEILERVEGDPKARRWLPAGRYLAFREASFFAQLRPRPSIAVVPVHGTIGSGRKAKQVVAALRLARKDRRVRGVLLHVNSPGGSATVSDLIHREVVRVQEKKPVVAFFGDVAASGGYYVASHASAIVAQPVTITGSIGVVSVRLLAENLLERVGVRTEVIRRAPHADMFSPTRPLEESERAILEREMEAFYQSFVALVADGRGRSETEVEPLARGRVWSGEDAKTRGLVDRLGGFEVAMEELRSRISKGDALEARLLTPKRLDVPPDLAKSAARAMIEALSPDLAATIALAGGSERVLLLEPSVPDIR
ncbi:MAG: signal peptide peptidase SppA [Myxococcota bacterium]